MKWCIYEFRGAMHGAIPPKCSEIYFNVHIRTSKISFVEHNSYEFFSNVGGCAIGRCVSVCGCLSMCVRVCVFITGIAYWHFP